MGRVYAVASAKGGVGKTTTTANLAVTLAAAGYRVAVVDADVGMPNLGRMLGLSSDGPTLHDVLGGDAEPLDAVSTGPHGLGIVAGSTALDAYVRADPRGLRAVVTALDGAYDVVFLDTGAGLSHDTALPLGLADAVLLVSTPSPDALGDTEKTRQLAERVGVPVAGLVLNRVDAGRVDVDALVDGWGVDLVGVVPADPAVEEASAAGVPVVTTDADAPASVAYRGIVETLVGGAVDSPSEGQTPGLDTGDDAGAAAVGEDAATDGRDVVDDRDDRDGVDVSPTLAADDFDGNPLLDASGETSPPDDSSETDAESTSPGGIASTLAGVETGVDETDDGPTSDESSDVSVDGPYSVVADTVAEAEPDADDEAVPFGTPDDRSAVTIQPDEAPPVPDAERDSTDAADGPDSSESPSAVDGDGDADPADESEIDGDADAGDDSGRTTDAGDEDDDDSGRTTDADGTEAKGLFERFFG